MSEQSDVVEKRVSPGTGESARPRPLRNVLSNWGGYAFSILVGLFLSPFVVHHLGNSAYGVWTLMVSLTSYLSLLDFGVRGSVTRYVSRFHARGEHESSSRVASSALGIFSVAGIVSILVSAGIAVLALHYFRIPEGYREAARTVLLLAGVNVAVTLLGAVFGGVLVGLHRFDLTNAVEVGSSGLRALATVVALWQGKGIITLALLQILFNLAGAIARVWLTYRLYPELRLRWASIDKINLRLIYTFSLYSFLIHVSGAVILYTDAIVVGLFLPVSFVTIFSIGGNLFTYARGLVAGITQTITPLASKLEAEGAHSELQRMTINMSGYTTALMLPIYVTFLLRGSSVIGLWMGPEYAGPSGHVLWVLTLAGVFYAAPCVAWATMFGTSKHAALVPMYVAQGLLNLGLSIWLVKPLGVAGVAWGTTIPMLMESVLFWPWYLKHTLGIAYHKYAFRAWGLPILAIIPFAICSYSMEQWWPAHRLIILFAQIALAMPTAALPLWYVCVPRDERAYRLEKLRESMRLALGRT